MRRRPQRGGLVSPPPAAWVRSNLRGLDGRYRGRDLTGRRGRVPPCRRRAVSLLQQGRCLFAPRRSRRLRQSSAGPDWRGYGGRFSPSLSGPRAHTTIGVDCKPIPGRMGIELRFAVANAARGFGPASLGERCGWVGGVSVWAVVRKVPRMAGALPRISCFSTPCGETGNTHRPEAS